MGIGGELGIEGVILQSGGAGDRDLGDVDEEFVLQSLATDEDREAVAAAVGKGEKGLDFAVFDFHRERDAVANLDVAGGITDLLDGKIVHRDALTGVKRVARAEKSKLQLTGGIDADAAGPDRRRISAGVDFGRDAFDASDSDEGVVADDGEIFGSHRVQNLILIFPL